MATPRPVATHPRRDLLPALREMIATADDAVLASAFIDTRGIHLVGAELRALGPRCRLVATSAFGGDRTHAAYAAATELGTRCWLLNPPRGTFHPKVIVTHRNGGTQALVGSANLTAGLVANIEAGVIVGGSAAAETSALAEAWWSDPVAEVSRAGLWVETERSRRSGSGPQPVEPRMLDVAWAALISDGELTNRRLLRELRVHRSSFVCALLARLPGVRVASRHPIRLVLDPDVAPVGLARDDVAAELRAPFDGRPGE